MYLTPALLREFEERFGRPQELSATYEMSAKEYEGLLRSQKDGRRHDVTFFIVKDGKWVVISKPWYPPGLYRIPSGGVAVNESIAAGILREAREETGCEVAIQKYFLRINVRFSSASQTVDWVSHLALCRWLQGELVPLDKIEIKEVRLAARDEFDNFARIMLESSLGGLHYREFLHRQAFKVLDEIGVNFNQSA